MRVLLLALGCVLLLSGCAGKKPAAPPLKATGFSLPAPASPPSASNPESTSNQEIVLPSSAALPPLWYWTDRQQQQLDRRLHEQREQYYRERQPPPQFQRPPVCNSYSVGGQVYTQCY
jgi:hypothetical protein